MTEILVSAAPETWTVEIIEHIGVGAAAIRIKSGTGMLGVFPVNRLRCIPNAVPCEVKVEAARLAEEYYQAHRPLAENEIRMRDGTIATIEPAPGHGFQPSIRLRGWHPDGRGGSFFWAQTLDVASYRYLDHISPEQFERLKAIIKSWKSALKDNEFRQANNPSGVYTFECFDGGVVQRGGFTPQGTEALRGSVRSLAEVEELARIHADKPDSWPRVLKAWQASGFGPSFGCDALAKKSEIREALDGYMYGYHCINYLAARGLL